MVEARNDADVVAKSVDAIRLLIAATEDDRVVWGSTCSSTRKSAWKCDCGGVTIDVSAEFYGPDIKSPTVIVIRQNNTVVKCFDPEWEKTLLRTIENQWQRLDVLPKLLQMQRHIETLDGQCWDKDPS